MYIVEKTQKQHSYTCTVVAQDMGHRCGYITFAKSHPWSEIKNSWDIDADVHGGITYSQTVSDYPITYQPDDLGRPTKKFYSVGFDCGHAGDGRDYTIMSNTYKKIYGKYSFSSYGIAKSLEYCVSECNSLAKQAKIAELEARVNTLSERIRT